MVMTCGGAPWNALIPLWLNTPGSDERGTSSEVTEVSADKV